MKITQLYVNGKFAFDGFFAFDKLAYKPPCHGIKFTRKLV